MNTTERIYLYVISLERVFYISPRKKSCLVKSPKSRGNPEFGARSNFVGGEKRDRFPGE